jgi:hypothetical protein
MHKLQGAGIDSSCGQGTRKRGAKVSPEKREQWSHAMPMHDRGIKGKLDQLSVLVPPGEQMGKGCLHCTEAVVDDAILPLNIPVTVRSVDRTVVNRRAQQFSNSVKHCRTKFGSFVTEKGLWHAKRTEHMLNERVSDVNCGGCTHRDDQHH